MDRTQKIRWSWVFWNFFQVIGVTFYLYFILARFCVPVFRQIGRKPLSAKALVISIFSCMLPGTLVLLLGFFAILHSWFNAFAEMLRFGDRMFYQVPFRTILLHHFHRNIDEYISFIRIGGMHLATLRIIEHGT